MQPLLHGKTYVMICPQRVKVTDITIYKNEQQ